MADQRTDTDHISIAIIGAGIGGAAAAIALRQVGLEVDVFEAAPELIEVGGAIVMRAASMTALSRWGVLDAIRPKMVAVNHVEIRDRDGYILGVVPTAIENGESEVAYAVHRADLHDALISNISPERLHLGHRLASIDNVSDHAEATFENGRQIHARLIVGAEGFRSVVRTFLDATPMTFLNRVVHRTIAPASLLPADMPNDRLRLWQGGSLRLNLLPVRNGAEVAIEAIIPAQTPPSFAWSSTIADGILSRYANFDPLILWLIEGRTVPITTHPIYDKAPLARWADRHIVSLGDGAHPMAPMNGKGANQAIRSADALASVLRGHDDLASALVDHPSIKTPAPTRLQMLSRTPPPSPTRSAKVAR